LKAEWGMRRVEEGQGEEKFKAESSKVRFTEKK
jgi:hypothetical protein